MKYSQFNSIIPYGEKYALYNTYEDKVIFLEPQLKDILLGTTQAVDNLKKIHPDFYNYLLSNKFLVPKETDELEKIKKLAHKIDDNNQIYELTINPTVNCNFRCWYCYETHEHSQMSSETIARVNQLIHNKISDKDLKNFSIAFFGGEPLLYFDKVVIPITDKSIETCKTYNKKLSVGFTTNGYLINDKFINYFNDRQTKPHFQITLDGYRENHDRVRYVSKTKGSYALIINNIKKLINNQMFVRLRINYTDDNVEDTYKIAEDFSDIKGEILKEYLLVDYHRVWQNTKIDDINMIVGKNMRIIKSKGLRVKSSSYNSENVKGACYADKRNSAVINYNGDVFKCTARDFRGENRMGYLHKNGEIIWENNSLEHRMNVKFHNRPCFSCRLLAICNGGCSQQALEHLGGVDYCIYAFDEKEKDKVIKNRIDLIVQKNETVKT
ncbi:radical SAM/SPASM domain-containing protein [Bacteroidia bacterium]|nr:radical SAM/SPASM domain-containing protein [Bacteroidia bacterium]